ncbi:Uncharacterised protein [Serratia entomophila]|nr:hypothetical protein [Serratia entomophila]CAI1161264.1 Uncharacterised protein [Serratia entomophila]CAI1786978.1 Uncharacterised protein [Serratia entomophila]CAI1908860.1 Uncharacterised protein [Serratia entomophila]CAI1912189.1 Uncharacterised protein [Serratia entomophila]CAI1991680.1 Uncharacterised protein [Serratia entomophila]
MATTLICQLENETKARFDLVLADDENPDTVAAVLKEIDTYNGIRCLMGHVVISGQTIWVPTHINFFGTPNMVTRTPGVAYLYAPGQSICFNYGTTTESARVNRFGAVPPSQLEILKSIGELVWRRTVTDYVRRPVILTMKRK